MNRQPTGTCASLRRKPVSAVLRPLTLALALAISGLSGLALAANNDLVVLDSERWIDTLKGTIRNMSPTRAEEVVIVVRFYGQSPSHTKPQKGSKSTARQELGRQTVTIATLDPGQDAPFEVDIAEKHRTATSWAFEPHAIWRTGARASSRRR